MPDVLLVAATERELDGRDGLVCGIGPVEAAASTARALALGNVAAVLHLGVAGGRGLVPGTLVIGSEAVYCDLAAAIPVVDRVPADPRLVRGSQRGASRRARPADRDERGGRQRRGRRAGRGDGGLRRPPRRRPRRRARASRCGRSRTRLASPTARAGGSGEAIEALSAVTPLLLAELEAQR